MPSSSPSLIAPLFKRFGEKIERSRFSHPPILIGGCARSGTTLLLGILGAHPRIFPFPKELGFLTHWEEDQRTAKQVPSRIDRFYRELILHRIPRTVHRWCEKSPANVRHIDKILDFYGEGVRFIHIIRDPRDVCISEHPQPSKRGRYHVDPERWVRDVKAGLEYQEHPSVLTVRYEDLIRHSHEELDRICRFIGEERPPEIDDWSRHTKVKQNRAWKAGAKPLTERSIGNWKEADPERLREILEYPGLEELMQHCGYAEEEP